MTEAFESRISSKSPGCFRTRPRSAGCCCPISLHHGTAPFHSVATLGGSWTPTPAGPGQDCALGKPSRQIYGRDGGRGTCSDIYNRPALFYGWGSANSLPRSPSAPVLPALPPPLFSFSISSEIFHRFKGNKVSSEGNANSLPGLRALKSNAVRLMGCWGRPPAQVPFRSHHAAGSTSSPSEWQFH